MNGIAVNTIVATAGFVAGIVFGATAQRTNFCTMGALSDIVFMDDHRRFRAWMLAIAVAMIGSQALHMTGVIDLGRSIYLAANFGWLGAILGGLLFGFGMTLTGGCGNKTLVRLGAGNLKSIVVFLFLAISAYMTLRGLLGVARVNVIEVTNLDLKARGLDAQGLPDMLSALGLPQRLARGLAVCAIAGACLVYCLKDAAFRASPPHLASGLIIGALIPAGWLITGVLGADDFNPTPLATFTFVAPAGETVQYLMTYTGATINFGIAVVAGVIAGAFVMAKATGTFKLESFVDADDFLRHMLGGVMMGAGGVLALGCTIGQGISGLSTLALGSLLAFASIVAGGVLGFKYLEEGSVGGALRALLARG
ncbi:MAG: YeeE/YedE family protein [Alphaproteobacteria bacterium]|nr:YeeE/YedE family protein [Alphaproteobacteria bacterium]